MLFSESDLPAAFVPDSVARSLFGGVACSFEIDEEK